MSTHNNAPLPSKDSIRQQLKGMGYANIPDEVLNEFMVDLERLYKHPHPTASSSSVDPGAYYTTEESEYEGRSGRSQTSNNVKKSGDRAHNNESYQQYQPQPHHQHHHQYDYQTSDYSESDQSQSHHLHHASRHSHSSSRHSQSHCPQQERERESEYESENAGEAPDEAYIPARGIHIVPHSAQHQPRQSKTNLAYNHQYNTTRQYQNQAHAYHPHHRQQREEYTEEEEEEEEEEKENHSTRTNAYAYAHTHEHARPAYTTHASHTRAYPTQAPPRGAVYESDYSTPNDDYPYYRHAPMSQHNHSHYSNVPAPHSHPDMYYSEDDDAVSRPLSSLSISSSRYPGGRPNSSGVIWAKKSDNGRAIHKSDPVSRYQEVQRTWKQDPFLRSQASNKNPKVHIAYEPPYKPPRKDLSLMRPDYVVPTEKRRDNLRFNVRAKMMS